MKRVPPARRCVTLLVVVVAAASLPAVASFAKTPAVPPRTGPDVPSAFRPGELVVKRERGPGIEAAVARSGGRVVSHLGGGLSLVGVGRGSERAVAARLTADPAVDYAEPNYIYTASSHVSGELPWGVRRTQAPVLWHRSPAITGSGVRVAVLDSGVDAAHPQLSSVTRGFDVYGGNGGDDCGHGTAVAGVIAASAGDGGIVGVAPAATIVPVKVLAYDEFFGCGSDTVSVVKGIRWASDPARGDADIINMSFGGPDRSQALQDAVQEASSRGVLMVGASGNTGDRSVHYPAAYREVVSVGGLERDGADQVWWPYSTFGSVDIAAAAKDVPVLIAGGLRPSRIARRCTNATTKWCSDGTSFAAPHVAGVAALLVEQHDELDAVGPAARIRRLRQWILGTTPRVRGSTAGVDLHTGHGSPDARAAVDASADAARVLVTWHLGQRILAPTSRMTAMTASLPMKFVATRGTGAPLANTSVAFSASDGGRVSNSSVITDSGGSARTTFRSTAAGRRSRLVATIDDRKVPVDSYVLQYDDNVPGVRAPATVFRGRLNLRNDFDDVFRFSLLAGERLRVDATDVDQRREYVALYLHHGTTRDVTDPYHAPLREDSSAYQDNPLRLSNTVQRDGTRYLDVYGYGSYRLRWWIVSPGRVRSLSASPKTFSPDGDGYRDRTRLRWELKQRGRVTVRVRNDNGNVVRMVDLGAMGAGWRAHRWSGRNNSGSIVRNGVYRVTVEWRNGSGRRSSKSTKVTVAR